MKGFFETFKNYVKDDEPYNRIYQDLTRAYNMYKKAVFVEGEDDQEFYSSLFNDEKNKYVDCDGKSKVKALHKYFNSSYNKICDYFKYDNIHFVVDKDYEFNLKNDTKNDVKTLNVTKYYSIENYAFSNDNKKIILRESGLNDQEIKDFLTKLNNYFQNIKRYEVLLAMTENYKKFHFKKNDLKKENKDVIKDNVTFSDDLSVIFSEEFECRINETYQEIQSEKKLKKIYDYYNEYLKHIFNIRGKDLEYFFDKFMIIMDKNVSLKSLLFDEKILSQLNIDLKEGLK